MPDRHRRAVLASFATGSASLLAGCNSTTNTSSKPENGNTTTSTTTPTSTQSPSKDLITSINSTSREDIGKGTKSVLAVDVASSSVSAIALRTSAGEELTRRELGTGTSVDLPLREVSAGSVDILAIEDGEVVEERSTTLERSYTIETVALAKESFIGAQPSIVDGVKLSVKNTGDLPIDITSLKTRDGVPNPAPDGRPVSAGKCNPSDSKTVAATAGASMLVSDSDGPDTETNTGVAEIVLKKGPSKTVQFTYSLSGDVGTSMNLHGRTNGTVSNWSVTNS